MWMTAMTEQELANHLFAVANARAAAGGRHLGEGADNDLRAMTQRGAAMLVQVGDPQESERQIAQAAVDIVRLIDMALEKARELTASQNYPPDLLGELSYFPTKLRFCPCPPFC
jgi:hypothetical protein